MTEPIALNPRREEPRSLAASRDHPEGPGVYLFKDAKGRILYVGKAKNLRRRLASYFRPPAQLPLKTRAMVAKSAAVDTLCTTTEKEALLLESSLIKKHRPRYNICLRDDKQYVLFKLDAQTEYPRLTLTRRVLKDGALYYGPFISSQAARQTLKAVHRLFNLRRCKDTMFRNRVRPCLYHHMGQCLGPCVLDVSRDDYADMVRRVRMFLGGRSRELATVLSRSMQEHSERLEYEKAAEIRDLLKGVQQTLERQAVVLSDELDRDVIGLVRDARGVGLSILFIRQGRLLDSKSFFWPTVEETVGDAGASSGLFDDSKAGRHEAVAGPEGEADHGLEDEEGGGALLESFLVQFYGPERFIPERIILPAWLAETVGNDSIVQVLTERRGAQVRLTAARGEAQRRLVEMAEANALETMKRREPDLAVLLADALRLAAPVRRIEAVDVSHLGGQGVRVGMVVFEDGRPRKDAYRIHAMPELEGTHDDYLALTHWAERRIEAGPPWPDLLLIDGGLGQLAAVGRVSSAAGLEQTWNLASMAKAGRRGGELGDKVFRPGRKNPLPLRPGSKELLFLQQIRDAAHRFVISRQRKARERKALDTKLEAIPGVGPKTARLLWDYYPDISAMTRASLEELTALPGLGADRAKKVYEGLRG
ncbi:excinuclease ABC subunit UvrC [Desulfonatronum sp. SC1]|uniref:excinuclease ABC subunit UvrC n=1 Tax=Desulfonatronum sp. SC1 TaxID=2109626 RepID=UPI000D2F7C7D|nr:excinuclease ABC subunit UvrC [Desulfonatronum sp. SC1]PTN37514.1 excinuclease ABC subunit C [Desulfonatronum sp. SC1]